MGKLHLKGSTRLDLEENKDALMLNCGVHCINDNDLSMGAYRALCEKLAVLHHREFSKYRRLKGRH